MRKIVRHFLVAAGVFLKIAIENYRFGYCRFAEEAREHGRSMEIFDALFKHTSVTPAQTPHRHSLVIADTVGGDYGSLIWLMLCNVIFQNFIHTCLPASTLTFEGGNNIGIKTYTNKLFGCF